MLSNSAATSESETYVIDIPLSDSGEKTPLVSRYAANLASGVSWGKLLTTIGIPTISSSLVNGVLGYFNVLDNLQYQKILIGLMSTTVEAGIAFTTHKATNNIPKARKNYVVTTLAGSMAVYGGARVLTAMLMGIAIGDDPSIELRWLTCILDLGIPALAQAINAYQAFNEAMRNQEVTEKFSQSICTNVAAIQRSLRGSTEPPATTRRNRCKGAPAGDTRNNGVSSIDNSSSCQSSTSIPRYN